MHMQKNYRYLGEEGFLVFTKKWIKFYQIQKLLLKCRRKNKRGTKIACHSNSYYNTLILIPENSKHVVTTLHHTQFTWCPRNRVLSVKNILQLLYLSSTVMALESKQAGKPASKQSKVNSTEVPKQGKS